MGNPHRGRGREGALGIEPTLPALSTGEQGAPRWQMATGRGTGSGPATRPNTRKMKLRPQNTQGGEAKRQRTAALQDAVAPSRTAAESARSWSAAVLCRFGH